MSATGFRFRLGFLLRKTGEILLRGGELAAAMIALRLAVRTDPKNLQACLSLSALEKNSGNPDQARQTLETGVANRPFYLQTPKSSRSVSAMAFPGDSVLCLKTIEGGFYMIQKRRNGECKIALRGGNLSDRDLIDRNTFATINYFVSDDNILSQSDLPGFNLIFNTIADADLSPNALRTVAEFLRQNPAIPVINHPHQVLKTTRDNSYRRFSKVDGVLMPKTVRLAGGGGTEAVLQAMAANDMDYPVLIRETGSHTGMTFQKFDNREGLIKNFNYPPDRELYLTQYVESLLQEQYFRKLRVFFIDGKIFPVVCHIDSHWNVHGDNRKDIMAKNPWMEEEEKAFMSDCKSYLGEERYQVLQGLYGEVGLDFFGADFTVTGQGEILLYEVNPVMRHKFDHADTFPYLRPHLENITGAFNTMIAARLAAK